VPIQAGHTPETIGPCSPVCPIYSSSPDCLIVDTFPPSDQDQHTIYFRHSLFLPLIACTRNAVNTIWDAKRYSDRLDQKNDGFNTEKELLLLDKYKPIFDPVRLLAVPATCADVHRNILLWYLPGILTWERQASPGCSEPIPGPDGTDRTLF